MNHLDYLVYSIGFSPLFLIGTSIEGILFVVFMYYTAGCYAGVFYKVGEKSTLVVIASVGFIVGVYLTEKGFLKKL
jgi:hypothetical protein